MSSQSQQRIEPGQVWLCLEHLESREDCTCGLVPYVPRSEVERLREALAAQTANCNRLIDRVAELGGFTDAPTDAQTGERS